MNFICPRCSQQIEGREEQVGRPASCPACGHTFIVSPNNARATTATRRSVRSSGGFIKLLLTFVLLALGGLGYVMYRFNESPQQIWRRLTNISPDLERKAAAPTPAPEFPAASPTPTPAVVVEATPAPSATPQAKPVDPLVWLLQHRDRLPREASLLKATDWPVVVEGRTAGSVNLQAGSTVEVTGIEPGFVTAKSGESIQRVAIDATDLRERARVEMLKPPPPKLTPITMFAERRPDTPATATPAVESAADLQIHKPFVHPGLLSSESDFERMRTKVAAGAQPWESAYQALTKHWTGKQPAYVPHPVPIVVRGGRGENFHGFANDIAVAYASALRWKVSGDTAYAECAVRILNAWGSTLTRIGGDPNFQLVAINGYQLALAAEDMRTYKGWKPEDFATFQAMMKKVFGPMCHYFLRDHMGQGYSFMWSNWDILSMDCLFAVGVLCDDQEMANEALDYFTSGLGEGCIDRAVYYIHPGYLGQTQESGRDQGHSTLAIALMAQFCEMAWHQSIDAYGFHNNRFLAGAEYVAKYNLGGDVPFAIYAQDSGYPHYSVNTEISPGGRGEMRPGWDTIYNHYVNRRGLAAPHSTEAAAKIRPSVYTIQDQPGFDTLTASLEPIAKGANPSGLTALVTAQQPVLSWWGSAYASSYRVLRAMASGGPYSQIASELKDNTYTDADAKPGNTYYYVVTADVREGGTTGHSNEAKAVVGTALLAQWKLDETSGTTATDATGHGLNGTLVNGAAWGVDESRGALKFNAAADQYVRLPDGIMADVSDFTISVWVNLASNKPWARIFDFGTGIERYMYLTANNGTEGASFSITGSGGHGEQKIVSTAPLPIRKWVHIAVTVSGTVGTLYVDGVAAGQNSAVVFTPARLPATTNNWMGRSQFDKDPYFDGLVKDFRIYRGPLTAKEVAALAKPK